MTGLAECIMWSLITMILLLVVVGVIAFVALIFGWVVEIRNEIAEERLREALEKEIEE